MFLHRNLPPSPYINRFLQPDTLIPDLSNPQGWNRYSYVTNRPVNFNDPTGHDPNHDACDYYGECELETYTQAGINTVSLGLNTRTRLEVWIARNIFRNDHVSEGKAKIYPEEAEKLGIDPYTPEGAFLGMQERIRERIDACTGCSDTDKFIVAALGADYNFSANESHVASNSREYKSDSGNVTVNWSKYLNETQGDSLSKDKDLISLFTSNVQKLKSQGYYVPKEVDFDYILNILLPSLEP